MSKKTPQIRFKGFTGDWEERKLGDVISISSEKNGNQFSRADVLSVSREAGVVNQIEYQGRSFAGASIANYRVVHKGDLIYTKSPLKGAPNGIFKTSEAEGIVSPLYAVYQSREANAAFVGWLLSNDNFATHYLYPLVNKGSKNTLLVSDADAISGHLSFPNIEEQAKIVSFFTQLDNLIALHQRKLDLLKEQKKGFLQKMFPKNGARVPELRFEGFSDDWEERKLGELGSVAMNRRIFKDQTSENEEVPFFKIGTFGSKPDAFISRELFEEYKLKYPYPEIGDILISASGSIGRIVVYQGEDEYFQDSNIVWLKHDNRLDNKFLKQFYSIVKWQGLEGSTIKRLYNKNILDTDISIPSTIEQNKIGMFFEQLDDTIALHQRKLDLLKEQKKGFLQKMFVS
ncbi:restriction endonuclease subunit S [Leuconostoc mesenteroides]|uniref:restriction endonuclease subunit S n=1 Tax=Leuconostoc mesenteroides TaxID=1245 RepID=UPI00236009B1|nr:restriction endonuclease subunit S [Leuconostoc mesenteroides]